VPVHSLPSPSRTIVWTVLSTRPLVRSKCVQGEEDAAAGRTPASIPKVARRATLLAVIEII